MIRRTRRGDVISTQHTRSTRTWFRLPPGTPLEKITVAMAPAISMTGTTNGNNGGYTAGRGALEQVVRGGTRTRRHSTWTVVAPDHVRPGERH
jgi:hypothetical protein